MRLDKTATRDVDPRIAAAAIILVLAVVQVIWWRGLVMRPHINHNGPPESRGGATPSVSVAGRQDVTVVTLAGDPEPGDADGPGRDARFDGPSALAVMPGGELVVADTRNDRIRIIAPDGRTRTLAGSVGGYRDGDAAHALFSAPGGVAVAPDGAVYVADTGNQRIRCIRDGHVTTVAGGAAGMADGPGSTAQFNTPTALCWADTPGGAGRVLLVADSGNRRLRAVDLTAAPAVRTVRALPGIPTAVAARGADLLVAVPNRAMLAAAARDLTGLAVAAPDAQGASPTSIRLTQPIAAAAGPSGWFVADAARSVVFDLEGGSLTVLAGVCQSDIPGYGFRDGTGDRSAFGPIAGLAADHNGHVYVADTGNNCIRKITIPSETASR